ncbi:MAG TPA: MFS transporter [Actinomycetota bacterium]
MTTRETARVFAAVLRSGSLRRVLLAFFLFNAAEWATWIAMLVYAFTKGGTTAAGLVALIQLVPAALIAPFGSVLGDRMRRDRALAAGYAAQALTMAITAFALWTEAPLPAVYAAAAVCACTITLTRPVHNSILPELATTPDELTASNAASSTLESLAIFAGPVANGILIGISGPWLVFAASAGASLVSVVMTVHLPLQELQRRTDEEGPSKIVAEAADGFRQLREEPGALTLTLLVGAQFVVIGLLDVLYTVMAIDTLDMGESGAGIMAGAVGVGGVVGAGATAVLVGRRRLSPALAVGIMVTGLPLAVVALAQAPPLALVMLAVSGAGKAFFDVAGRTLLQRTVPDDVLSRIFGVQEGLLMAGLALGSIAAPLFVALVGPRGAFVLAGAFLPLLGLLAWGRLRALEAQGVVPGAELQILARIPIFEPLAQPALERLSWNLKPAHARAGADVITEGERGDLFYVIQEGTASVVSGGAPVATLGPGDYFGEIALLRNVPRTATVHADTDLELLTLDQEEFLAAVTGSRPSAQRVNAEIDRRLEEHRPGPGI